GIWVALGGDVEPAAFGAIEHVEREGQLAKGHARDVDHVQGGSGGGGVADHFLKRIDNPRLDRTGIAHVDVNWRVPFGGEGEDIVDGFAGGPGEVGNAHTDAEGALVQPLADVVVDLFDLGLRRGAVD